MPGFPYIQATARLNAFFDKVRTVNQPAKMTQAWLTGIGFTSSNDRPLISLMKELGYTDGNGNPTEKWAELRGSEAVRKASLGRQMAVGYPEVFAQYPAEYIANSLTKEELKNFIRPKVSAGTLNPIVATFFGLKNLATFANGATASAATGVAAATGVPLPPVAVAPAVATSGSAVNVSINLSLELPATSDADVYDKLFEAMAKHLGSLIDRGN